MINLHDIQYLQLVQNILSNGSKQQNRTGVAAISLFGPQMRFSLRDGTIPLLTTKKMFIKGIIYEIIWYLTGTGNIKYLTDNNVHIWDEWATKTGDLGDVYGVMWRKWVDHNGDTIDQIADLIHQLKTNPTDRRLIVTSWNPGLLPDRSKSFDENVALGKQALPPCHYTFQCYTRPLTVYERIFLAGNKYDMTTILDELSDDQLDSWLDTNYIPMYELSLLLNQRSCDVGLGVPFNIVQYSILLRMLAEVTNMCPGEFIWNGGNAHIYENHIDQLTSQLERTPYKSPTFKFARKITNIDDFTFEDFIIENYESHSTIKMDVAV